MREVRTEKRPEFGNPVAIRDCQKGFDCYCMGDHCLSCVIGKRSVWCLGQTARMGWFGHFPSFHSLLDGACLHQDYNEESVRKKTAKKGVLLAFLSVVAISFSVFC